MSELNSAKLIYPMNKEFQSRNIQNYIFYLLIFVNFPTLDFLLEKIKEREFKKYFCHSVLYFYTYSFCPIFSWEKKYFQQWHEKSTCKVVPIVGGFLYFLLLDLNLAHYWIFSLSGLILKRPTLVFACICLNFSINKYYYM